MLRTIALVLLAALSTGAQTLTVNAAVTRQKISQNIYGILGNVGTPAQTTLAANVGTFRLGGDYWSRYYGPSDASCDGADGTYFQCGSSLLNGNAPSAPPSSWFSADMISAAYQNARTTITPLFTIPIIPYVNATATFLGSYPVSVYGAQQMQTTYGGIVVGNGYTTGGSPITDTNPTYNMIANTTTIAGNFAAHIVSVGGYATAPNNRIYQLDNEPGGWSNTHRDAVPTTQTYDTIASLGASYSAAIKAADPNAPVAGPSDYYPYGLVSTALLPSGVSLFPAQYYLAQMRQSGITNATNSLDYFDEHGTCQQISTAAQILAEPRILWDPSFTNGDALESYFGGAQMLIPRYKNWVNTYYPGLKVSISEYECQNTGLGQPIVDMLAQTELLGIFGYQGLDMAEDYNDPTSPEPEVAFAFLMFENYDGAGHGFGDTSVQSTSTDATEATLPFWCATRSSDGALTCVVENLTTSPITSTLNISGYTAASTANVYTYSNSNLSAFVHTTTTVSGSAISGYSYPAYSATEFVMTTSGAGSVTLTPSPESFGTVNTGSSSSPVTFTLTNNAATSATGLSLSNISGNTGDFIISSNTCGSTLAASASCTLVETFTPLATGSRATTLTASYSGADGASPQTSALSGTGTSSGSTVPTVISGGAKLSGGAVLQ